MTDALLPSNASAPGVAAAAGGLALAAWLSVVVLRLRGRAGDAAWAAALVLVAATSAAVGSLQPAWRLALGGLVAGIALRNAALSGRAQRALTLAGLAAWLVALA